MSKFTITDEILLQYLAGTLPAGERAQVDDWLEQAPNRRQMETLRALWLLTAVEQPAAPDTGQAWMKLKQRTRTTEEKRRRLFLSPATAARLAAGLLLALAAWGVVRYTNSNSDQQPEIVKATESTPPVKPVSAPPAEPPAVKPQSVQEEVQIAARGEKKQSDQALASPPPEKKPAAGSPAGAAAKEEICNSTLCPLEICIVQSLECEGGKPSVFAHCSMLRPEESGTLHYKMYNKQNPACKAPVQEVRITRMNTGETIVLNERSTPLTAQDFFDYVTGSKKGDVTAGIFESDCNNQRIDELIRLDNSDGTPVLQ